MSWTTTPGPADREPQNALVAERRTHTRAQPTREHFAPVWLLASLILATVAALAFLYPKAYIETSLRRQPRANAATLAYLRLMVMARPDAAHARILLARQALSAGDVSLSRYALRPWLDQGFPALAPDIAALRLRLLRSQLDAARSGSAPRAELTEAYAHALLSLAPRMELSELLRETRFVAALGQYRTAAHLYRHAIARAKDAALRRQAFHAGVDALLASGHPASALAFAQAELASVPHSAALWRQMTRLALMANQPRLAAAYARRLLGMQSP